MGWLIIYRERLFSFVKKKELDDPVSKPKGVGYLELLHDSCQRTRLISSTSWMTALHEKNPNFRVIVRVIATMSPIGRSIGG
jgi:hypothetical protein